MKNLVKSVIGRLVSPIVNEIYFNLPSVKRHSLSKPSVKQILFRMAKEDSADFVMSFIKDVMIFDAKEEIWDYCISELDNSKGTSLEFGVHKGRSINYFSSRLESIRFLGFDSFEGLAEEWKGNYQVAGHFDLGGNLPIVNSNCELIKGFFDERISERVGSLTDVKFVHIDCDTYPSTKIVLHEIQALIKPGLLILFDDYIGYPGWRFGEYLAFKEFAQENNVSYRYRAFSEAQALIEIIEN